MEINATNEARSTENTTKNQTTFRLGLHLSTAHGDPASDTYADFNFAGSTPDEFDHALATILDVVTSTVYGGQLNGLQEIIDRSTAELRADSEKAQHGAATLEDILRQEPPEDDAQQPKPKHNPALDVDTPKISTVTEPRPSFAPLSKPGALGAKGLMLLACPGCHHTFKHFARENTDKVKCFCGTEVPVDNVARFEFTCKQCGKLSYGWTNIESAVIEAGALNCVCLAPAPEMLWNPATRKFHG